MLIPALNPRSCLQVNFDSSGFKADEEVAKLLNEVAAEHEITVHIFFGPN